MMPVPEPTIYLIAGCNGAGKTTFAREFLPKEVKCLRFLNADEIARGLSPLAPGVVSPEVLPTSSLTTCRWLTAGWSGIIAGHNLEN
jgi:hypothetical protein